MENENIIHISKNDFYLKKDEGIYCLKDKRAKKYVIKGFNHNNVIVSLSQHSTLKQAEEAFSEYKKLGRTGIKTKNTVVKKTHIQKNDINDYKQKDNYKGF